MVDVSSPVLSASQREILIATKQLVQTNSKVQLSLASGRDVSSAIDDPQSFFTSRALENRSGDLVRLLEGIGASVRTIEVAEAGLNAISGLLDQADSLINEALIDLFPVTDETPDQRALDYIRAANDDKAYFSDL